jgi:FlaG/FlaF family flagellin (archaellin)
MKKIHLLIASFAFASLNLAIAPSTCQAQATVTIPSNATAPKIKMDTVSNITAVNAKSNITLQNYSNDSISSAGLCFSINPNPEITNNTTPVYALETYTYNAVTMNNLTPNTTYYVRPYATNSAGTTYGNEEVFTTKIATMAVVKTDTITNITATTAVVYVKVSDDGNDPNTKHGFYYSTSPNPTSADSSNSGYMYYNYNTNYNMYNLIPNTTYYIKAFATNMMGTAYGKEQQFTTGNAALATVQSNSIANVTAFSAVDNFQLINIGNDPNTVSGVCYSHSTNPTITNSNFIQAYGSQTYTVNIASSVNSVSLTSLTPNTTYYVRAYSTNAAGTTYSNELSFTTNNASLPTVTTDTITQITATSARVFASLSDNGNDPNTTYGFCYKTSPDPTTADSNRTMYLINYYPVNNDYSNMYNLLPNTTYYVKAFATNVMGTTYGKQMQFTTGSATLPIIETDSISNITSFSATAHINIKSVGNDPNAYGGICYSTTPNPTMNIATTVSFYGTYTVTTTMSSFGNLTANTTYYVRAFETNIAGTAYGNELTFTTGGCISHYSTTYEISNNNDVFTLTVDSITSSTAKHYEWDFGDGSTSKLAAPNHNYTADGVYTVCLKIFTSQFDSCTYCHTIGRDAQGNVYRTSGFSLHVVNKSAITGIEEIKKNETAFSVFPNPTKGEIKIMFDQTINNTSLKLLNLTGQTVFEQNNISNNLFTFDIAGQTTGMYILEVNQNGSISRTKVIKE